MARVPTNVLNPDLYEQVKEEAREKFDVYPSIYANAWVVRTYKQRGGQYGDKKGGDKKPKAGLLKWFDEKWVDLSRPIHDDAGNVIGFQPCGRPKATAQVDTGDYPKCRPLATALSMTPEERADAIQRKRRAESKAPKRKGRTPVYVQTFNDPRSSAMARRNASFTGSQTHGSGTGSHALVAVFYEVINNCFPGSTPIPIPPPDRVHPAHNPVTQAFIFADYAVRKFGPIFLEQKVDTTLAVFPHGDQNPRVKHAAVEANVLRNLPKIVDYASAEVAERALRRRVGAPHAYGNMALYHALRAVELAVVAANDNDSVAYAPFGFAGDPHLDAATNAATTAAMHAAETVCSVQHGGEIWKAVNEMLAAL
jgi:hypothetical protein